LKNGFEKLEKEKEKEFTFLPGRISPAAHLLGLPAAAQLFSPARPHSFWAEPGQRPAKPDSHARGRFPHCVADAWVPLVSDPFSLSFLLPPADTAFLLSPDAIDRFDLESLSFLS
jgi:hypothetical protein